MDSKRMLPAAVALSALLCASPALAQEDGTTPVVEETQQEATSQVSPATSDPSISSESQEESSSSTVEDKSWYIQAAAGIDLGIGAFVRNEYARRIRSKYYLSVQGGYKIPVIDTYIEAATGFMHWISVGGGSNRPQEFRWSDSNIGFSRPIFSYKGTDSTFSIGAGLHFTLPTSTSSIASKLYTEIAPSISLSASLSKFSISYSLEYSHSFHKNSSMTYDPSEVDVLSREGGVELLSSKEVAVGGILTEIALSNTLQLSYSFLDNLTLSIGFGFADYWTYDVQSLSVEDEYTSPFAHVGRGHSQRSAGSVDLLYSPCKYLTLDFFMKSNQPWKTSDNKEYRFPWLDTVSYARNYTRFGLNVIFQY